MKAIESLLKGVNKIANPRLAYAWTDAEGRQCVCDGYRSFRLNQPLPLEDRPNGIGDGIDLSKIVPKRDGMKSIPLPSYA